VPEDFSEKVVTVTHNTRQFPNCPVNVWKTDEKELW